MPKIPGLPLMNSPDGADEIPIEDVSVTTTKYITLTKLKEWLQSLVGWITTAMIADDAVTNAKWTNTYRFSAYRNAALTPSGTQQITFDAEDFDIGSNYNTSNGRFTAPIAGTYLFTFTASTANPNRLLMYLYKNGSAVVRGQDYFSGYGSNASMSSLLNLAANDYVECYINTSVQALSVGSGSDRTQFQGFLVSQT